VQLDTRGSNGDYPRGWSIRGSDDGEHWSEPLLTGQGDGPLTRMVFATPATARYLRIEQTGRQSGLWWSIHELSVFVP